MVSSGTGSTSCRCLSQDSQKRALAESVSTGRFSITRRCSQARTASRTAISMHSSAVMRHTSAFLSRRNS